LPFKVFAPVLVANVPVLPDASKLPAESVKPPSVIVRPPPAIETPPEPNDTAPELADKSNVPADNVKPLSTSNVGRVVLGKISLFPTL